MESFIFYESFYAAIKLLPKEEKADAYEAIAEYSLKGIEPSDLQGMAKVIFTMAKPQIDANTKRRLNGFLGGRPKKETDGCGHEKPVVCENEDSEKPMVMKTVSGEKPKSNANVNVNVNNKGSKKKITKKIKNATPISPCVTSTDKYSLKGYKGLPA